MHSAEIKWEIPFFPSVLHAWAKWDIYILMLKQDFLKLNKDILWNFVLQRHLRLYKLCRWWCLINISWIIIVLENIFVWCIMRLKCCQMVHSSVKFRQNICICYKWICRAKFQMYVWVLWELVKCWVMNLICLYIVTMCITLGIRL